MSQASHDESRGSRATVLSVATLIGGAVLAFTETFPGGLSGGSGFLLGFAVSFASLSALVLFARRSESNSFHLREWQVRCPRCDQQISVELKAKVIQPERSIESHDHEYRRISPETNQ